jgi:hypothetical protein
MATPPEHDNAGPAWLQASWAVVAAFTLVFGACAARTVQGGDAGEFMTLAAAGGVAHPPGYPLFTLGLRVLGMVPIGSVPWRASMLAALLGAGALGLVHATVRDRTGSGLAGWVAAGALGFTVPFFRYATVAEVFAGAAFTGALVVYVASRIQSGWRGPWAGLALGLAVATGVANHHTVILLAPIAVWAALTAPGSWRRAPATWGATLGGLVPGFLAYGLLLLPGGGWRWGETGTLDGVIHHVLRRDYGTFNLALDGADIDWWAHALDYAQTLPLHWVGVFAAVAVLGLVISRERQWSLALLATWVLAGPVFLCKFNVPDVGLGVVVASRFTILPTTVLAVAVGMGAAWLLERSRAAAPVLALALVLQAAVAVPQASHARWTVLEDYVLNALGAVEPGAYVVVASDSFFFGGLYAQTVLDVRPDVVLVHPRMLSYAWYRRDLGAAHPELEPELLTPGTLPELVERARAVRPVYLSFELAEGRSDLPPLVPESLVLARVAPVGMAPPPPAAVEQQLLRAQDALLIRSTLTHERQLRHTWEGWAPVQYARAWTMLGTGFEQSGDAQGAARCQAQADAWVPWTY